MGSASKPSLRGLKDGEFEKAWPLLEKVVQEHGGYWKEDIRSQLESREMQCHVYGQDPTLAVITQIVDYPRLRVCLLLFAGGSAIGEWKDSAKEYFESYARANGCREIQILGRKGWRRIYPHFSNDWCVYRDKF